MGQAASTDQAAGALESLQGACFCSPDGSRNALEAHG